MSFFSLFTIFILPLCSTTRPGHNCSNYHDTFRLLNVHSQLLFKARRRWWQWQDWCRVKGADTPSITHHLPFCWAVNKAWGLLMEKSCVQSCVTYCVGIDFFFFFFDVCTDWTWLVKSLNSLKNRVCSRTILIVGEKLWQYVFIWNIQLCGSLQMICLTI